jgi:hypothetical protein
LVDEKTILEHAQDLDRLGLNVVPATASTKKPAVDWKPYQTERTTAKLPVWLSGKKAFGLCVVTGAISQCVVLDIDSPEAYLYWHERIGSEMDRTVLAQSPRVQREGGGTGHYYFHIESDDPVRGRSRQKDGDPIKWDLKANGGITICPPSAGYAWIRSPWDVEMLPMPPGLRTPKAIGDEDPGNVIPLRSKLADLLTHPGEGGRNNWVTRVLGHYAKQHSFMRDLYEVEAERVWAIASELSGEGEYTRAEFDKTLESIWNAESAKPEEIRACDEACGYLVGSGYETQVMVKVKKGDDVEERFDHWGDFNMKALGVVEDTASNRTYDVEIYRRLKHDTRRALLPANILAEGRRLNVWLAEHGVGIAQPSNSVGPMSPQERLRRYLEHQEPPQFEVVDSLGWHQDGFVCHEGVITADGHRDHEVYKPNPKLLNWAPYQYGFAPEEQTRSVLREILTFHEETVASVFGSWAMACLLKPQIHQRTSQFPFMALEAPSESGKTTGMFSMIMQLMGNTQGQIDPTRASLRDYVSAHQSGIVWIDDLSDISYILDLLRQATGEGSVSKKGEDRHTQEVVRLVAPIVISGEALQLGHQKALTDRAVTLDVPSPIHRKSLRNPERRQWYDVLDVWERYPDMTTMSGTLVRLVLERVGVLDQLPDLTPSAGGRWGDKIAIVRAGARILADITGDAAHVERADLWAGVQDNLGSENTLTTKLIPRALQAYSWPTQAAKAEGRWPATPVLHREGRVWFRPDALAQWWSVIENGRVSVRTETAEALQQQADALGAGIVSRKRFKLSSDRAAKLQYIGLSDDLTQLVLNRSTSNGGRASRGDGRLESPRLGVHPAQLRLEMDLPANLPPDLLEDPETRV